MDDGMKSIESDHELMGSPDIAKLNLRIIQENFPEAIADGEVKWDVLRELLGAEGPETQEKYGLGWSGKRLARQVSLTPSNGTLLPCMEDSVHWATTKNLMIEGDNLEVMKLLQKSYGGRVKVIYIDPPYNTGGDFVYPDDLRDSIGNYLALTGQTESGKKISSNTETSGRFHTTWLNMIYPRLKVARSLLREDGVIFVSIDDHEKHNLIAVMCEIFGEENFVGVFVWKRRTGAMDSVNNVSVDHEYVVCFSRSVLSLNGKGRTFARYSNPDNDPRGPWIADNLSAAKPGGDTYYPIKDPATGFEYLPPKGRYWPYSRKTMEQKIIEGRIIFPGRADGSPLLKRFKNEAKSNVQPISTWIYPLSEKEDKSGQEETISLRAGHTSEGTKIIKDLFEDKVFTYAKPISLIDALIGQATQPEEEHIVLDFFSGSGTTGHATLIRNAKDNGNRRFILVQLPEPLSDEVDEQQLAANFCDKIGKPRKLSELTKERLRRAGTKVKGDVASFNGDIGFRVFKLATSNIRAWNPDSKNLSQTLLDHHEHILPDRTEDDIAYELLLKLGLDLCVPMESRTVSGKTVRAIGGGVLMVCLADQISANEVESLAAGLISWHTDLAPASDSTVVFRDSAFSDDVAKTNMAAILAQNGLENVRSL